MRVVADVAYPEGPITLNEAVATRRGGEAIIAGGCRVIDMAGVTQVDSSALSVLLAWRRYALNTGVTVETRNLPASLIGLIDLYGVRELIPS